MTDRLSHHGRYYAAPAPGGKVHLVAPQERQSSTYEALTLCGHHMPRRQVRFASGVHKPTEWLDRHPEQVCGHCIRWATSDPDLEAKERRLGR